MVEMSNDSKAESDLPDDIGKKEAVDAMKEALAKAVAVEEESRKRPANPMDCLLTDEQLFAKLPMKVASILHKCKTLGTLYGEDTETLRAHLETIMRQRGNPFPVTKLYKEYVGGEINSVLNASLGKKLDHYWEKWELPLEEKKPLSTTGAIPTTIKPQDIPGVERGPDGRFVAGADTVEWIKTQLSSIRDSAAAVDFVDRMRGYFGNDIIEAVKRSITRGNTAMADRMAAAPTDERTELDSLNKAVSHTDLPGIKLLGGQIVFSQETVSWVEDRVGRMIKLSLNPDPFCMAIFDMCGEDAVRRLFGETWARFTLTQLSNCTTWPVFLEKMIRELILTSRRSGLLAGPSGGSVGPGGPVRAGPGGPGAPGYPPRGPPDSKARRWYEDGEPKENYRIHGGARDEGAGISPAAEAAIAEAMMRQAGRPNLDPSITGMVDGPRPLGAFRPRPMGPLGMRGPRPMMMRGPRPGPFGDGFGPRMGGPMGGPMGPYDGPMGPYDGPMGPMGPFDGPYGRDFAPGPIRMPPRGLGGRPLPYGIAERRGGGGGGRPYVEKEAPRSTAGKDYFVSDEGATPGSRKAR